MIPNNTFLRPRAVLLLGVLCCGAAIGCTEPTAPPELELDDEMTLHRNRLGKHVLTQVDRFGLPAVNTVFIPSNLKDDFNLTAPADDVAKFRSVVQDIIVNRYGGSASLAATIAGVVTPDIQPINTSEPSGFLNGRRPQDDVITAELMLLFGTNAALNDDHVDANDMPFLDEFPFLARPHGDRKW